MKIIDKTPWQDAKGEIGFVTRIQESLRRGFNWYAELEAQKAVIDQLNRVLEKGFVLIRNFTLPGSEIIIPIILISAGGMYVIYVTNSKGVFEAKGDQWNVVSGGKTQPAPINFLTRIGQLTRAFQKYLDKNNFTLPVQLDSILIASDPGAQIESLRPIARVVRSDGIRQFAASLAQARPVFAPGAIYELADQIIDPSLRKPLNPDSKPVSRAQAIFNASSEPSKNFDPNDLGFEFEDGSAAPQQEQVPADVQESIQSNVPASAGRRLFGMNTFQLLVLGIMMMIECCILIGFGYLLFFST